MACFVHFYQVSTKSSIFHHELTQSSRQAQELNMHRQARVDQSGTIVETLSRLWYDEYKRRVWIILFIWDRYGFASPPFDYC